MSMPEPPRKPDPLSHAVPPVISTTVAWVPLPVVALVAIATFRPCPAATTESPLSLTATLVIDPLEETTSAVPGPSSGLVVAQSERGGGWCHRRRGLRADRGERRILRAGGNGEAVSHRVRQSVHDAEQSPRAGAVRPTGRRRHRVGDVGELETLEGADHDTRACLSPGSRSHLISNRARVRWGWLMTMCWPAAAR